MTTARSAIRLAWGATLLGVPASLVRAAMGRQGESEEATALVRALGVRHVTQAALGLLLDGTHVGRASRRAGAVVDVLHVGSLAALARLSGPGGRRLVAVDAPVELLLTALQAGSARTH